MLKEKKTNILLKKDKIIIKGKKYFISGRMEIKFDVPSFRGPFKGFDCIFDPLKNLFSWHNKSGERSLVLMDDLKIEVAH